MRIRPIFAWYDMWIGAYWDRDKRRLYVLPLPCVGFVLEFRQRTIDLAFEVNVTHDVKIDMVPKKVGGISGDDHI